MSQFSNFFQKNLGLKIVSLFLAIVAEIYFYSPDNSVSSVIRVRVDVVGLPPNYVVTEPRGENGPFAASVQVRGPRSLIDQIRTTPNRFRVALPPGKLAKPGTVTQFSATLDANQLSFPTGVETTRITPERITVKAEREVKKELIVVLDRRGMVPEGYRVANTTLFPDSVVVRGPYSQMQGLKAVETVAVDIEGLREPIETEISLKDMGPIVTSNVTMVRAKIDISEVPKQRLFENVQVRVLAPKGYAASLEQPRASIVLSGQQEVLNSLSAETIALSADARSLPGGVHELPLSAELPDGVKILSTEPARVKVRLTASGK